MLMSQADLAAEWRPMVNAAHGVLGSWQEAEECASVALLQVLEQPPVDINNMQAFLVTVAKRRAVDRLRSLERDRRRQRRLMSWVEDASPDIADDVACRAEASWIDEQARLHLRSHVYGVLRHVADGLTVEEAAIRLGMTERAARSHLRRARVLMRKVLAKAVAPVVAILLWARRQSSAAALTGLGTAAFCAIASLTGLPGAAGSGGETILPALRPAVAMTGAAHGPTTKAPPGPVHGASGSVPRSSSTRRAPSTSDLAQVREPLGASTALVEAHHGQGPKVGPVQTVVDCLAAVQVSPDRIGC